MWVIKRLRFRSRSSCAARSWSLNNAFVMATAVTTSEQARKVQTKIILDLLSYEKSDRRSTGYKSLFVPSGFRMTASLSSRLSVRRIELILLASLLYDEQLSVYANPRVYIRISKCMLDFYSRLPSVLFELRQGRRQMIKNLLAQIYSHLRGHFRSDLLLNMCSATHVNPSRQNGDAQEGSVVC